MKDHPDNFENRKGVPSAEWLEAFVFNTIPEDGGERDTNNEDAEQSDLPPTQNEAGGEIPPNEPPTNYNLAGSPNEEPSDDYHPFGNLPESTIEDEALEYDFLISGLTKRIEPNPIDIQPGTTMALNNGEWQPVDNQLYLPDESAAIRKATDQEAETGQPNISAKGDGRIFIVQDIETGVAGMVNMPYVEGSPQERTEHLLDEMIKAIGPLGPSTRAFVCSPTEVPSGESEYFNYSKEDINRIRFNDQRQNETWKRDLMYKTGIDPDKITIVDGGDWQSVSVNPHSGEVVIVNAFSDHASLTTTYTSDGTYYMDGPRPAIMNQFDFNDALGTAVKLKNFPDSKEWIKAALDGDQLSDTHLDKYHLEPTQVVNMDPYSDTVHFGLEMFHEDHGPIGQIQLELKKESVIIAKLSGASLSPDQHVDIGASLCDAGLDIAAASGRRVALIDINELTKKSLNEIKPQNHKEETPDIKIDIPDFTQQASDFYNQSYKDTAAALNFHYMANGIWRRSI